MLDNYTKDHTSINSELSIKQEKPSKQVLVDNIEPHNNHIIYEINQFKRTINVANFETRKVIHWFEAVDGSYKNHNLIKLPNCIYISSLNKNNLIKKINSKFGIDISSYDYIPEKGIVGSFMNVNLLENISK